MVLTNARRLVAGGEQPLTRGRLQLQSEGAEVFFRRIRLRPIRAIPAEYQEVLKQPPPNTLTAEERSRGWRLLFDGESTEGWRGYRLEGVPAGWQVRDGVLTCTGKAGDLITTDLFDDFELWIDWRISGGGNSGIFYRVAEGAKRAYETGPEFEIRDHAFWADDPYTNGANYALHPPRRVASRPVGYWNRARILVQGNRVEHWLNGEQVVSYELHSPEWQELVQGGKARSWPGYGRAKRWPHRPARPRRPGVVPEHQDSPTDPEMKAHGLFDGSSVTHPRRRADWTFVAARAGGTPPAGVVVGAVILHGPGALRG